MPELVDEIRVPLHELQADVDYLIGRVIADPTCAPTITASIKGKLAAIEAAALILNEPQEAPVTPADALVSQIEDRFPNWKSFRDLVDCIDCTLHGLRGSKA